ncbi:MAG: hypothetical protein HY519_03655 [Candidatus Aenigmarchaeota archaeon]|nr:hypothetical protein [Candidatus Aenigmarchaeota archaeon]
MARDGRMAVHAAGSISHLGRLGIQSRYEIVAAERPEGEIFQLFRERLLDTRIALVCCNCLATAAMGKVREITTDLLACKKCGARMLAEASYNYLEAAKLLLRQNRDSKAFAKDEQRQLEALLDSAALVAASGLDAVKVLAGRGVGSKTAARILAKMNTEESLLRDILSAERQYFKTRAFWKDRP